MSAALLLAGAAAWANEARAAETDSAEAEALFQRGRQAAARGDWSAACAAFAESLRVESAAGTRLNLADCQERTGLLARAWENYQVAASQLPTSDRRHEFAMVRARSLDPRIPRLIIRVVGPSRNRAIVEHDGVELSAPNLGNLGVALRVDPGRHVITLRSTESEHAAQAMELVLTERDTREVVMNATWPEPPRNERSAPSASTPRPDTPAPPSHRRQHHSVAIAALGIGAAGIVAGSVAGLLALDAAGDVRKLCDADLHCTPEGLAAGQRARLWSTVSTASFLIGGVGVAVGGYMWFASPKATSASSAAVVLQGVF